MDTFKLEISTDNAAFDDNPRAEISRILRSAATILERFDASACIDANGQNVGYFAYISEAVINPVDRRELDNILSDETDPDNAEFTDVFGNPNREQS